MLLSDTDAKGHLTFRLYDVLTGKDIWSQEYAANARVMQSEDASFSGVVEPDGTVRILDIRNGKEAMKAKMDPKFLDKVNAVHLLYDGRYFFVACSTPTDPAMAPWGGVMSNLYPGTGLRALPINGELYAFDAQTGKTKWHNPLLNQMIVLDHFADMPIVLATSRYNRWMNIGAQRQVQQAVVLEAINKTSGKFAYKSADNQMLNTQQFHELKLDPKKGIIELTNFNTKITFTATDEALPEKKTDPMPEKNTTPGPRKTGPGLEKNLPPLPTMPPPPRKP